MVISVNSTFSERLILANMYTPVVEVNLINMWCYTPLVEVNQATLLGLFDIVGKLLAENLFQQ